MKEFNAHTTDFIAYKKELSEFKQLLDNNAELSESKQILPFFRQRPNLSSRIATLLNKFVTVDRLPYEFDIFGDFTSDMAIGDSTRNNHCFIEFEDAREDSIFIKKGKKYTHEFSPRFEHGFSQIIDCIYKLDDLRYSASFEARFGSRTIEYDCILILGRNHFLTDPLSQRVRWRNENTVIHSKHVYCYTLDDVYNILSQRQEIFAAMNK